MMSPVVLGVDLGTTTITALAWDPFQRDVLATCTLANDAQVIRISAIAALVLAGMLPWMGCHRKPAMMRIWGKVSLDGKPVNIP